MFTLQNNKYISETILVGCIRIIILCNNKFISQQNTYTILGQRGEEKDRMRGESDIRNDGRNMF